MSVGVIYSEESSFTVGELSSGIDEYYRVKAAQSSKYRIVENTTVQFAGYTARKVVIEDTTVGKDSSPHRVTNYYVLKGDKLYNVWGYCALANASDFNVNIMEKALSSFEFTR
ncbi:hypothetical protein [Cohnella sp.]|uniref:hypothetical protein n=1 Tax=Cohnella sp. TaxID=1883426 RepID=UPI00356130E7